MVDPIGIHWLKFVACSRPARPNVTSWPDVASSALSVQLMVHGGDGMAVQAMVSLDGTMSSADAERSSQSGSKDSLDEMTGD